MAGAVCGPLKLEAGDPDAAELPVGGGLEEGGPDAAEDAEGAGLKEGDQEAAEDTVGAGLAEGSKAAPPRHCDGREQFTGSAAPPVQYMRGGQGAPAALPVPAGHQLPGGAGQGPEQVGCVLVPSPASNVPAGQGVGRPCWHQDPGGHCVQMALRTTLLYTSVKITLPSQSATIPRGALTAARAPTPRVLPAAPEPITVSTAPLLSRRLRTRLALNSVMYSTAPAAVRATPVGLLNITPTVPTPLAKPPVPFPARVRTARVPVSSARRRWLRRSARYRVLPLACVVMPYRVLNLAAVPTASRKPNAPLPARVVTPPPDTRRTLCAVPAPP